MRYAVHHHRHAFPSSEVERRLLRFTDEAPDDAPPATAEEPDRAEDAASALEPYLQRIQNELAYGDSNDVLSSAILQYITDNGELLEGNVTTLKSQIEKMLKDNNIRNVDSLLSRIPSDGQGFVDFAIKADIISNYQKNDAIKEFNKSSPQQETATYTEGEAPNSVTVPEKREVDVDAMAAEITALKQEVASYNMQRKALQEEMRAGMMPLRTQQKIAFRRAFLPRFQELRDSMNNPSARLSAALQNFYEINGFTYAGYLQGQRDAGGPRRDLEDGGYQMETPSGGLMTVRPRRQPLFVNTVTGKEYTDAGELNNLRTIKTYNRLGRGVVADDYFARMRLQDELGLTQYAEARRFKNGLGGMIADTRTETMALLSPEMMRGFDRRLATASRQGREVFKPYGNNYAVIGRKPSRMLVGFGFRGQNIQAPLKTRDGYSEYTTVDGRTIKFSSYTGETIRTRKQLEEAQNQYRKEKNAEEEKKITEKEVKTLLQSASKNAVDRWIYAGGKFKLAIEESADGETASFRKPDNRDRGLKDFYYGYDSARQATVFLLAGSKNMFQWKDGTLQRMNNKPAFATEAERIIENLNDATAFDVSLATPEIGRAVLPLDEKSNAWLKLFPVQPENDWPTAKQVIAGKKRARRNGVIGIELRFNPATREITSAYVKGFENGTVKPVEGDGLNDLVRKNTGATLDNALLNSVQATVKDWLIPPAVAESAPNQSAKSKEEPARTQDAPPPSRESRDPQEVLAEAYEDIDAYIDSLEPKAFEELNPLKREKRIKNVKEKLQALSAYNNLEEFQVYEGKYDKLKSLYMSAVNIDKNLRGTEAIESDSTLDSEEAPRQGAPENVKPARAESADRKGSAAETDNLPVQAEKNIPPVQEPQRDTSVEVRPERTAPKRFTQKAEQPERTRTETPATQSEVNDPVAPGANSPNPKVMETNGENAAPAPTDIGLEKEQKKKNVRIERSENATRYQPYSVYEDDILVGTADRPYNDARINITRKDATGAIETTEYANIEQAFYVLQGLSNKGRLQPLENLKQSENADEKVVINNNDLLQDFGVSIVMNTAQGSARNTYNLDFDNVKDWTFGAYLNGKLQKNVINDQPNINLRNKELSLKKIDDSTFEIGYMKENQWQKKATLRVRNDLVEYDPGGLVWRWEKKSAAIDEKTQVKNATETKEESDEASAADILKSVRDKLEK